MTSWGKLGKIKVENFPGVEKRRLGEAMSTESLIVEGKNRKSGKRGETAREVIKLLVEKPRLSFRELAEDIGCSYENIYFTFEKLKQKPETAALYGYNTEDICFIMSLRSRKSVVKIGSTWRGKANWPASQVATKQSLRTSELVKACGQHYAYRNGKYRLIDKDINTIPKSISIATYF
ncbi:MAG: hypothetical protein KBA08_08950 [Firmicutes bacterium]|nr:hypothetical protein [Bacillota bacterium]